MVAAYFDQFNIIPIFSIWVYFLSFWINGEFFCFTNTFFMMSFAVFLFYTIGVAPNNNTLVPNRILVGLELIYTHFYTVLKDNLGNKAGNYLAFVLSLFILILFGNGLGLFPYVFTPTVHMVITLGLSLTIIIGTTLAGLITFRFNFFSILMPQGAPLALAPLLTIIETLSYISRAISLGVRLAANISSGHLLFSIIASFAWKMINAGILIGSFVPFAILIFVTILEMAVAIIQAYVFTLLTIVYLRDTVELH
uniref:ATP synthase subunit a n=3 Tax=unclassified Placozoa TaxID=401701 RepID=A0A7I6NFI8_9METZ|nr:ATP synthase F0 subunit 6 [Placozoan sp. 'Shirahama']ABI53776.1 ATP synthase F0 subunit 6 [Placozoan sp. BZ49]BAJ09640.1 ATP synthase F0 subunit 6 [Placozoan sp. 'Shirahama']BBI37437.1 ATP synthase F0 subunit a [Placozoa sp. H9 HM-2017]